ncbi:MAG: hypothetical protein VX730_04795 [Pseudomonadota bacterium]|nr:hypothetical protein [Pseudomonadota bacterium]
MKKLLLVAFLFFTPASVIAGPADVDWQLFEHRYGSDKPTYRTHRRQSGSSKNITGTQAEEKIRRMRRGINCSFGEWQCRITPKMKGLFKPDGIKLKMRREW